MKRSTSVLVLVTVFLVVAVSHIDWVTRDNGNLVVLDGKEIDLAGILKNQWTQITRNCEGVVRLAPADDEYQISADLIKSYSPPQSKSVQIAGVWSLGNWTLAEAEFVDLLPAVVLIDFSGEAPQIISNAVWSGYTQPWKAAPFIRAYLMRQVPGLPLKLASCFEPQSASFR